MADLPDSGERRTFTTGSVRDKAEGKGRYDLVPPAAIFRIARRMEDGMQKYGERNWEKGQPMSVFLDSALRHMFKYLEGRVDEDHLGAALWNLAAIAHFEGEAHGSFDEDLFDLMDLPIYEAPMALCWTH